MLFFEMLFVFSHLSSHSLMLKVANAFLSREGLRKKHALEQLLSAPWCDCCLGIFNPKEHQHFSSVFFMI